MFILLTLVDKNDEDKGIFHMMVPVDSISYIMCDDEDACIGMLFNGVPHVYSLRTDWHVVQDRLAACGRFVKR